LDWRSCGLTSLCADPASGQRTWKHQAATGDFVAPTVCHRIFQIGSARGDPTPAQPGWAPQAVHREIRPRAQEDGEAGRSTAEQHSRTRRLHPWELKARKAFNRARIRDVQGWRIISHSARGGNGIQIRDLRVQSSQNLAFVLNCVHNHQISLSCLCFVFFRHPAPYTFPSPPPPYPHPTPPKLCEMLLIGATL
jgi:hypothetical protein